MAYNVLIVDDSPAMRTFVRRVLNLSGFDLGECYQAGNGQEGLAMLAQNDVNVVLTDINMPVMDGEQFVAQLSAEGRLATLPVVVVSTDSTSLRMDRMIELGAHGYVTKPFTPEVLGAELERVMGAMHAHA